MKNEKKIETVTWSPFFNPWTLCFHKDWSVFQSFYHTLLTFSYFKRSVFWHALESHLWDVYKTFWKNYIFGSVGHKSFIQLVKYPFPNERIVCRSFYGAMLTFSYFCLSLRKLCVTAPISKSLAWTVSPCDEKIVCLKMMGLLKRVSIWQKSVICDLTAK